MTWAALIPLIIEYAPNGILLAERIWQKWTSGKDPTQADFDELKTLGKQTVRTQIMDGLTRAGIPLEDPRAVAILAAIPSPAAPPPPHPI